MIDPAEYSEIICLMDDMLMSRRSAVGHVIDAQIMLTSMNIDTARKNNLGNSFDSLVNELLAPQTNETIIFFKALQKHVDTHYGLAHFLGDYGISIPERVATLSASLGYTIPDEYITEFCANEYF